MPKKYKRIIKDKDILRGTAVVKGTRISVSAILDQLSVGNGDKQYVKKIYPQLKQNDIDDALGYAADVVDKEK